MEILELRQEAHELRRENGQPRALRPSRAAQPTLDLRRRRPSKAGSRRARRRRFRALLGVSVVAIALTVIVNRLSASPGASPLPNLASLTTRQRIVAVARSQVGYSADPQDSYCNKFSAHWDVGSPVCPSGETSEQWCADFAAWVWQTAGVRFTYGYGPDEINAGAASFYSWGLTNGDWHPANSGYVAQPGDVAVYGLSLDPNPSAAHVAIVTDDPKGQRGPDVVNGDGDRTGFSVVETGTNQTEADTGDRRNSTLAGYVSPA